MKPTLEQMKTIICHYADVDPGEIEEKSKFVENLDFNSFDLICMIEELEESFGVKIDERRASQLLTVKDAMDYIVELQSC